MCSLIRRRGPSMTSSDMRAYVMVWSITTEVCPLSNYYRPSICASMLYMILTSLRVGMISTVTRSGYGKPDAQEVFENFFGTKNPFADFGFNEKTPFGSKLKKPGPKKAEPVVQDLALTLEELFNGCSKRLAITRKVRTQTLACISVFISMQMLIRFLMLYALRRSSLLRDSWRITLRYSPLMSSQAGRRAPRSLSHAKVMRGTTSSQLVSQGRR